MNNPAIRPYVTWFVGYAIFMLLLPATVFDAVVDPDFHAPHWQCDSIGVLILRLQRVAMPLGVLSFCILGHCVLMAFWRRADDLGFFAFPRDTVVRTVAMSVVFLVLASPFLFDAIKGFWQMMFLQTWTEDCDGRAREITVSLTRSPLQFVPYLSLAMGFWFLHLRAVAVSKWVVPE